MAAAEYGVLAPAAAGGADGERLAWCGPGAADE